MKMNRNTLRLLGIILMSLVIGAASALIYTHNTSHGKLIRLLEEQQLGNNKVSATMGLIERYYIDSLVTVDTLVEEMMPLLMERLDPHSSYFSAEALHKANESLDGEFEGIGIVFNMAPDTVIVLNVITSGPSDKAGLMARDRILRIGDRDVAGVNFPQDSVVKLLKGPRGTVVKLGIERSGLDELLEIEVTRDKVAIHSITAALMLTEDIGYVKLSQFARTTHDELMRAAKQLQREGMTAMILDLRGNPGGYLDQAIKLSNEFLPKNKLIVYTEDRDGERELVYSEYNGSLQSLELAVLIDESSASSSEILAGALQDNDYGTIIGRRSFGKGLIQRQIPFKDGSAIRPTISSYFTPTGRSIQKPFERGNGDAYQRDLLNRIEHSELFTADSILFVDSLRKVTPGGKVVYGGGGIMPDIFVPLSTDSLPSYFRSIVQRNILYKYTIEYSDLHREALAKVETTEQLNKMFEGDERLVDDFIAYATLAGVEGTSEDIEASRELLEMQLRGYIGRNTKLEDNGFYINIYPLDDAIVRAIEELEKKR